MPTIFSYPRPAPCALVVCALAAFAPSRAFAADEPAPAEPPAVTDTTPTASASAPRRFGAKGAVIFDRIFGYNWSLTGDGLLGVVGVSRSCSSNTWSPESATTHVCRTGAWLQPSLDVGVGSGFTLGGTLSARLDVTSEVQGPSYPIGDAYALGLAPRVGYVIPINDDVFLWPRIGGGYTRSFVTGGMGDGNSWTADAEMAIGFRAGRYVFFSASPKISYASVTWGEPALPGDASSFRVGMTGSVGLAFDR